MNRHRSKNIFLLGVLGFTALPSHAHGGAEASGIFIILFCAIFGLFAACASQFLIRFKPRAYGQRILVGFAAASIVFAVSTGIWMHIWAQNYKNEQAKQYKVQASTADMDSTWLQNSLAQAACAANIPALKRELGDSNHSRRVRLLSLQFCAVEKSYPEVVVLLLDNLQKLSLEQEKMAHCRYLEPAFRHLDIDILAIFADRKMSLDCRSENKNIPTWWSAPYQANAIAHPRFANYLRFLKDQGIDLRSNLGDRNLLSYAMQMADAEAIIYLLQEGTSTQLELSSESYWSAKQVWFLRKFDFETLDQQAYLIPVPQLTKKEREKIDKLVGELNREEIQFTKSDQQRFSDWNLFPDKGAAFFHFLIAHGAKLHIPNQFGSGLIHERTQITEAFGAEFDQLSDQQMKELICPLDLEGIVQRPLYQWAKNQNNRSITEYLEKRQLTALC